MARRGYGGASLADIALAAGVTKNQLLHYFLTKEALSIAALEQVARAWRHEIAGPASMYPQGEDALRITVAGLSAWVCDAGAAGLGLLSALRRESALLPPAVGEHAQALEQDMLAALRRHTKSAARSGRESESSSGIPVAPDSPPVLDEAAPDAALPKARQRALAALALACGLANLRDTAQPPPGRQQVEAWLLKLLVG